MRADMRTTTPVAAVVAIAAAAVLVHVAFSLGYGHHRDELYFLAAGRRLALGYVDQPPLTPLLARLSADWFGGSLAGLRLFPALGHGALVVLAALLAAEFGGGRVARWLAAVCVAVSSLFLVTANSLSTTAVDQVVWVVAAYLVVRLLRSRDGRWWLGIGAAIGVGLQNKHTVLLLAAGLVVALIPARLTGWLRTPWPWAGAAVALALWAPNLWWQAAAGCAPPGRGWARRSPWRCGRRTCGGRRPTAGRPSRCSRRCRRPTGAWPPRWRSRRCRSA